MSARMNACIACMYLCVSAQRIIYDYVVCIYCVPANMHVYLRKKNMCIEKDRHAWSFIANIKERASFLDKCLTKHSACLILCYGTLTSSVLSVCGNGSVIWSAIMSSFLVSFAIPKICFVINQQSK